MNATPDAGSARIDSDDLRKQLVCRVADLAAVRDTIARYRDDLITLALACERFARLAGGIPDNWPGRCVLTVDEQPGGTQALNYLGESGSATGPTIDDWRKLRGVLAAVVLDLSVYANICGSEACERCDSPTTHRTIETGTPMCPLCSEELRVAEISNG